MPLWYSSAKNEHSKVLTNAGAFDTSHMAVIMIEGKDAFKLLQSCFTRDFQKCSGFMPNGPSIPKRCIYGVFLDESGGVIDDAVIYKAENGRYMCVVNAGMGEIVAQHLLHYSNYMDVSIKNFSDKVGKLDIQGPSSAKILRRILKRPERVYENFPYFSFKGDFYKPSTTEDRVALKNGFDILLSRTGYTGEFGFELFSLPSQLIEIPWEFVLPYNSDSTGFTKEFVGSRALEGGRNADYTYAFVGNDPRKVTVSEKTEVLDNNDRVIGKVLTCVSDMGIGTVKGKIYSIASPDKPEGFKPEGLSCGFIKVQYELEIGHILKLRDTRRSITVRVVKNIRPNLTARKHIQQMLL